MNLENNWKEWNDPQAAELEGLLQPATLKKRQPNGPLDKISASLVIYMGYGVLISLLYIYILVRYPQLPLFLTIGAVLAFNLWALFDAWKQYRSLQNTIAGETVLQEMERHYQTISRWIRLQKLTGLFIYPFAATGGFMLGGMLGSGRTISAFMSRPVVWVALGVTLLVLIPLCHALTRWMTKKSFGKHLGHLGEQIEKLKEE
jgi:hypothetical protein